MAVRFGVIFIGVIFITDNYTIDSVSQISQYQISHYCNFLQIYLKNKKIEFYFHKKISNGLPFGIIFIASNSDNPIDIDNKTKKLESCFRDTIKHPFYCPFTIEDYLILDNLKSCFVFQNKPNVTLFDNDENDRPFNLKQYLLGLKEKLGFELIEQVNEEIKINPPFCNYRVDSEQNLKINEIVEGLKSGKIIGKKIISNAFDLKERLFIDIINVINQKKRVALNHAQLDDIQYKEGVALDYALINDILINDIKYNLLDNTFHFIFDIDLHLIDD
ncbi:hypothetical protein JP0057_09500 [Helicobacter pylori]|uniref:hypothetical protein n=1 Tax=Helicobacter pylori TaxID=210 RepID=UPI001AA7A6FA|nr:hypothetical protein [Helicobacter pylori]GHQ08919.1 hypothetical protein JP0057_09500 [Helicobacter pylori]